MSWLGDSLNSLKGQITKITKDVLAEDENENGDEDPGKLSVKELEEQCAAKDLEITSLREENLRISQRFEEELKTLRNENQRLKTENGKAEEGTSSSSDGQNEQIQELQDQMEKLKIERDHLEELEKDHQDNICLVVQQRDNYKQELEKLKETHSALEIKYEELLNAKREEELPKDFPDMNLTRNQVRPDLGINLGEIIEKLHAQLDLSQFEEEEEAAGYERPRFNFGNFNREAEIFMEDMGNLDDLNDAVEEADLKNQIGQKLKELTQNLEICQNKQKEFEDIVNSQMKRLANIFFSHYSDERLANTTIPELVTEIENLWSNYKDEKETSNKVYQDTMKELEVDIISLTNDKFNAEKDLKLTKKRKADIENKYREKINQLQKKLAALTAEEPERSRIQKCADESQKNAEEVKRLKGEVAKLKGDIESKNVELKECYVELSEVGQELNCLRSISVKAEHDLFRLSCENDGYEQSMMEVKTMLDEKDQQISELSERKMELQSRVNFLANENKSLVEKHEILLKQTNESSLRNTVVEAENNRLRKQAALLPIVEKDLEDMVQAKVKMEKFCVEMQDRLIRHDLEWEEARKRFLQRESEQKVKIQELTEELNQAKEEMVKLQGVEDELNKCKEILVEMEMQRQELSEQNELIRNECASLKSQVLNTPENDVEIERLTRENTDLKEVCKKLEMEIENKSQNDASKVENENVNDGNPEIVSSLQSEIHSLRSYIQEQANIVTTLTYENNELKRQLQLASENASKLMEEMVQLKQEEFKINGQDKKPIPNGHGQQNGPLDRSDADASTREDIDTSALKMELQKSQEMSQRQSEEYKALQEQFNIIADKEAHSKKELERLRQHLLEMENYYVETIDEYKAKLVAVEEQLKNSSSFYTSNKVRDNQHLESLQSQIRLMSAQRDSLQEQLSTAQDEIQKQKAALVSLHVVLEQFQQDKERDCENITVKFQNQLAASDKILAELQQEKESLNMQLLDAKNGLQAASRLGEQLEKKNEYIADLESKVAKMEEDMKELEEAAQLVNKSDAEKVDKSLLKNLLLGYISSQKADRKEQVLRIMMSVLDFDEEERNKTGIDNAQPGWLSSLLHPKRDGESSSQSLSEAFIRFLENESRPQPQLKLLPEDTSNSDKSKSGSATPRPTLLLEELVLPTFNSPQSSESSILKDVLNNP